MYDLGLGMEVQNSQFIANQKWDFPVQTSNTLVDIFRDVQAEVQPQCEFNDEIVQILEEDGNFTLKSAYHLIRGNCDKNLQWAPLIWFKGCIKKHSICAWMFLRGTLKTKDFLLQRNVVTVRGDLDHILCFIALMLKQYGLSFWQSSI